MILSVIADDDFNSVDIDFTIVATAIDVDVSLGDVINRDDVNEAREQLVLVLEPDLEDMNFDEFGGVLVLTILDANRKNIFLAIVGLICLTP